MRTVGELHDAAMRLAEQAELARWCGDTAAAVALIERAYVKEREAAMQLASEYQEEPSRSVLLRSAASLAVECRRFREAEELVCLALAGDPPHAIVEELRNVLEHAASARRESEATA